MVRCRPENCGGGSKYEIEKIMKQIEGIDC